MKKIFAIAFVIGAFGCTESRGQATPERETQSEIIRQRNAERQAALEAQVEAERENRRAQARAECFQNIKNVPKRNVESVIRAITNNEISLNTASDLLVTVDGFVVKETWNRESGRAYGRGYNSFDVTYSAPGAEIFLEGKLSQFNKYWNITGTYRYTTVQGGQREIFAIAPACSGDMGI